MTTSALPGAIDALLTILRARPEFWDRLTVIDGPPTDDIATDDILVVGWSPDGDQAAHLVQEFAYAGARARNEDLAIAGVIDCWTGDDGFAALRARLFGIFGVIEQALRASDEAPEAPTLNGAVLWAHLTAGDLRQYFTDQGSRAALGFTVSCRARI
jgi:hypothetical protein